MISKTVADSQASEYIQRKKKKPHSHIKYEELTLLGVDWPVNNLFHKLHGTQKMCAQWGKEGSYVFPQDSGKCSKSMWHYIEP